MFTNEYPYTDFHELNLDWVIKQIKKLTDEWLGVQQEWKDTEVQWLELRKFVLNYFDTLDLTEEAYKAILRLVDDGIITRLLQADVLYNGTGLKKGDTVNFDMGKYDYYFITLHNPVFEPKILCTKVDSGADILTDRVISGNETIIKVVDGENTKANFFVSIRSNGANVNTVELSAWTAGDAPLSPEAAAIDIIKIEGGVFTSNPVDQTFRPNSQLAQSGLAVAQAARPFELISKYNPAVDYNVITPSLDAIDDALYRKGINNIYLYNEDDTKPVQAYKMYSQQIITEDPLEATVTFRRYNTEIEIHDNMLAIGYDEIVASVKDPATQLTWKGSPVHHSIVIDSHDIDTTITADSTNANLPTSKAVWDLGQEIKGKAIELTSPQINIVELPAGIYTAVNFRVSVYYALPGDNQNVLRNLSPGTLIVVGNSNCYKPQTTERFSGFKTYIIIPASTLSSNHRIIAGCQKFIWQDNLFTANAIYHYIIGSSNITDSPNDIPTSKAVWDALHPGQ